MTWNSWMFEPEALNQIDQNTESDCNAAWKGHISPLIPDPRSGDIPGLTQPVRCKACNVLETPGAPL